MLLLGCGLALCCLYGPLSGVSCTRQCRECDSTASQPQVCLRCASAASELLQVVGLASQPLFHQGMASSAPRSQAGVWQLATACQCYRWDIGQNVIDGLLPAVTAVCCLTDKHAACKTAHVSLHLQPACIYSSWCVQVLHLHRNSTSQCCPSILCVCDCCMYLTCCRCQSCTWHAAPAWQHQAPARASACGVQSA